MPFDGPDGYASVCRAAGFALRPKVPLTPSQWAEKNRVLSAKSSAEATNWRNDRVPYLTTIMDALDVRHPAWMCVFAKASQVGASECGLNWVGHTIDEDPAPMMALFPGEKLGRRWTRKRVEPMIASTPSLRAKIPLGRRSDDGNTLLEKTFPDGCLTIASANIPTDLASDAYAKLLCDEVDRFPLELGDEGDPLEVAFRRLATFKGRRKVFLNSSPTIESLSHINPWWLESSRGRYYVPCPECGEFQYLKWGNLKWPDGEPKKAYYACEHNGCVIQEHHKTDMLHAGEWRHERPEMVDEIIGFHVNCLYTPIGLGDSWADNAVVFERAKRNPAKVKVFTNTRLGETHKDPNEKLDWELIYNRREPFPLREIPQGVLLLTAGVDVQKDRIEAQIIGWSRPGRATVIDYRVIDGDPTRPEVWDDLDATLAEGYVSAGGVKMRLSLTLVDSGYLQEFVLQFTRSRKARGIYAAKGASAYGRQAIGKPSHPDVKGKSKARTDKVGVQQYQIGVHELKETLYSKLRADGGPEAIVGESESAFSERVEEWRRTGGHFRFSDQLPEEYFRQLCAEVFDPHKRRWVKIYERNEALDTMILAMAAALHHRVAVDRMSEAEWSRLEALYEPALRPAADAQSASPAPRRVPASASQNTGFGSDDWNL